MSRSFYPLLIVIFLVSCGFNCGNPTTPSTQILPYNSLTPKGIYTKSSTALTTPILNALDSGLTELFKDVDKRGYTKKLHYSDYTITVKDNCVDHNGTKVWLERNDDYNNTEYDQNPDPNIGAIYQAEQVVLSVSESPKFSICRDSEATMKNTARYGAEHIILYYNDTAEYTRTKIHTTVGHPIIPKT